MSSSCKPKLRSFRSDIHELLLAAETGQKADILTYSSGHLGPRSLNQSQTHRETKKSFWRTSQNQETPNPLTETKVLTYVKKKDTKASEVSRSRQALATDRSSCADRKEDKKSPPKAVHCPPSSLPVQPKAFSQKMSNSSSALEGKQHFSSSFTDQEGLNNENQLKTKQQFGRQVIAKQGFWAEIKVAEMHEKKLQKELKKLSGQSLPSRDRLAVFSDVFDDVCESSPVFGRILREIKTDYDLYINYMMASQSLLHDLSLYNTSLEDPGHGKAREMELQDAEKEVCRLEQEVRKTLEENKRVQKELQKVRAIDGTFLSGLQEGGTNGVQSKRFQVLNTWRDVQQLEEEIKEKLVSTVITTAAEKHVKDLKREIMRLIAANERLKTINKDLENKINMVLNRAKASKATRRMLWEEIRCDLQT